MKKRLSFLTLMALVLLLAVPLGGVAAQEPTATPAIVELGTGGTQLLFWSGLTGGDGSKMEEIVASFVEDNPDISVRSEAMVWDQFYQKLQASFVAGTPPDVFIMHANEIPHYASLGILRPSDDQFDTGGGSLVAADYAQPAFDYTVYNGQHYGVLLDNHGFGTWLNTGAFEKAGVDIPENPPTNAEELLDLATRLTIDANGKHPNEEGFDANDIAQWGMAIDWNFVTFQGLLKQFGGSMVSEDGKTATVNTEAAQNALQFMVDLVHKYHVAPDPASVNAYNAFMSGNVAMMASGTWFRGRLAEDPSIQWDVWPMWQAGPNPGTWVSAHVIFISPTLEGEKLEAAKRFVQYLSEHDTTWAEVGHVPARISSQEALDPAEFKPNIVFGQGFQEAGTFAPALTNVTEVNEAVNQEVNAAVNGQKSVEEALNDANARVQQILDRGGM